MDKNGYKNLCIVSLIVCTITCFMEIFQQGIGLNDWGVRIVGVICLVSLAVNIFCFIKSYGKDDD